VDGVGRKGKGKGNMHAYVDVDDSSRGQEDKRHTPSDKRKKSDKTTRVKVTNKMLAVHVNRFCKPWHRLCI